MDYRVLTVSREFGSGGGRIAQSIAKRLGWKLLDGALIDEIACAAHVDAGIVSRFDEHVEGWLQPHEPAGDARRGNGRRGGTRGGEVL